MDRPAKVYQAKGTLIVQLPKGEKKDIDGISVLAPAECFLVFEQYPSFVRALQTYWADVASHPHAEIAKTLFGNVTEYDDIEAGASVHAIHRSLWTKEPNINKSFYGLVTFRDYATPSDILKTRGLVQLSTGTIARQHLKWYLSFPIERMQQVECSVRLRDLCQNDEISLEQKAKEMFRLLRIQP